MDTVLRPIAWALGALAFGAVDLYAVGGAFDQADLLLGIGAAPVVAFGIFALRSSNPLNN